MMVYVIDLFVKNMKLIVSDPIYFMPFILFVVEVKPLTSSGIKLSPANPSTLLPAQMTNDWIAHAARRLAANPATREVGQLILDSNNIKKVVIGVKSDAVKLVMLR